MRLIPRLSSRPITPKPRRPPPAPLRLQTLEDRSLPSFGFGSAFNFGGTAGESGVIARGSAIVLDAAGNMYVTGFYNATVDVDPSQTNSARLLTAVSSQDGFAAKYAADGTFQWASDLGPGAAYRLAVQGSSVYVPYGTGSISRLDAATGAVSWTTTIGSAAGAAAIGPSGSLYAAGQNGTQAVVDQIDPASGSILWSRTSSGGSGTDAYRLAVDASGNSYVAGTYSGTTAFGTTTLESYSGVSDIFVWKVNSSGKSVWAGSMGSAGGTSPGGIAVDASGNAYLAGDWFGGSNNFNPGSGKAATLTNQGGDDIFIAKLVPGANGSLKLGWAKDIGGSNFDWGGDVGIDGAGNVYTTGYFTGPVNFNPNPGTQQNLQGYGSSDIFVSKLDPNGNYIAAADLGGTAAEVGRSMTLDGSGDVYVTGFFSLTANFNPNGSPAENLNTNGHG